MRDIYKRTIAQATFLDDDVLKYTYFCSLWRSLLQLAAITAFDVSWHRADEEHKPFLSEIAKRLLQPSDGDFLEALDRLIQVMYAAGWKDCVPTWFDIPQPLRASIPPLPLRKLVEAWIQERNNRTGHGVLDRQTVLKGLADLPKNTDRLLNELSNLIPSVSQDNLLTLPVTPFGRIEIESTRAVQATPIVIRRYKRAGSCWKVQYQTLDPDVSDEGQFEVLDSVPIVTAILESTSPLRSSLLYVGKKSWNPSFVVPSRQTDTFEGREIELRDLLGWWNDPDSRACLVSGEGGVGKTTLVLQFLNSLLESPPPDLEWLPQLIFYFSAKQ
jgi:hypothetical protein